jgi:hypothetical protein
VSINSTLILAKFGLTKETFVQAIQAFLVRRVAVRSFDQRDEFVDILKDVEKFLKEPDYRRTLVRVGRGIDRDAPQVVNRDVFVDFFEKVSPALGVMAERVSNSDVVFDEAIGSMLAFEFQELLNNNVNEDLLGDGEDQSLYGALVPITREVVQSSNLIVKHFGLSNLFPDLYQALTIEGRPIDEVTPLAG